MKHRFLIFAFIIFVLAMLVFDVWMYSLAFGAGIKSSKKIVLCFDDGPRPYAIEKLLPVLKKYDVPGAFFVEGAVASGHKELVKKIHDAGHDVENHSWSHEKFTKVLKREGREGIKSELSKTSKVIFEATGKHPRFFRPPFWVINDEIEKIVRTEGYTVMKLENPDINTEDYTDFERHRPPEALVKRVKKFISDREKQEKFNHVLVFHELPVTAEALEALIPYFQSQGYKFISLDEMFPPC